MNKATSFLFAVAMVFSAMSQTVDLRFTGQLSGGSFVCLDSVKVENITRAWSETLVYPDTVLSFTNVGINDVQGGVSSLSAYPNPMGGRTTVSMSLAQSGTVTISVYDLSGRSVAWHSAFLEAGAYAFNVSLEAQQVYLLAVATPTGRQTLKLVNLHGGSSNAVSNLIFTGVAVAKGVTTRPFGMGDAMKYTGYATFDRRKLKSAAKHQRQAGSEDITLVFGEASVMPQGALTGVFSVSQNGRVHFSSGNLQWSATGGMTSTTTHTVAGAGTADGTWRFAPNQWDVIGESNANISSSYNGWIDLFGWGTSGYGNKHPYLIDQRPAFYVNGVNSISGTNYDWGVFNAISNGGDAPDLWRTLTFDEMQYLLFYRHTISGISFAKATLENTAGLVLFPDNWDSTAFAINNANDGGADFSVNNLVQSDWMSILEPAGCVFLPAAGYRYGTQVNDVGVSGNVWLSTYYDERDAHSLRFTGTGMRSFGNFRYCGGSVRLVCDETAIQPIVTTDSISNLDDHSALAGGNVVSDGGTPVTERGVCWSTSPNPTVSGSHTTDGTGTGSFTSSLTGLTAVTTYYVRAYATNAAGTAYGNQITFTTSPVAPTVTTTAASNITVSSATTGGNVTSDGGATVTARGVCWGTSPNPTISGRHTTDGTGTGSFTSSLTGLTAGTTYYVRAYATNAAGTAYGNQDTFITSLPNNLFSVAAGSYVCFSPGNLQWSAKNGGSTATTHTVAGGGTAAGTWRFAPNQWDTIGRANSNASSSYSGWIDLFGWGTSGYHDSGDQYNTNYQPYSTSTATVNTTYNFNGYGPSTNMSTPDISGTNYDWGVYNAIYNPRTQTTDAPGTWRTLTNAEWSYLINTRSTTSGIRYAKATVNGVPGLIIVPDDWSTSTYALNSTNTTGAAYTTNVITSAQWATLENAGCAFLPAAGHRFGTSVYVVGYYGYYWSASYSDSYYAYYMGFYSGIVYTAAYYYFRYSGHSVRLVRNAQ